jgi:predicted DNA-binding transcriptional regulator YafY
MSQAKTERLLELVGLLLKHRSPVGKEEIRKAIPDYTALKGPSFDRTFERDKSELRSLGIPVKAYSIEDRQEIATAAQAAKLKADEIGYLIDREEYYLQDIDFTSEEWAAISLVGSLSQPDPSGRDDDLKSLLQKIGCLRAAGRPGQSGAGISPARRAEASAEDKVLPGLQQAAREHVTVEFSYHTISRDSTEKRKADPYLLLYNTGVWYLVAHCHKRQGVRTFKVSRISDLKLLMKTPRFSLPPGFEKERYSGRKAWELGGDRPLDVLLKADPRQAWLVRRDLGPNAVWEQKTGRARLPVNNPEPFIRWAAANCDRVLILEPKELADGVEQRVKEMLNKYN